MSDEVNNDAARCACGTHTKAACDLAGACGQPAQVATNGQRDPVAELVAAADAVVERWHSRDWKQPHTAEFIGRLAAAVGAMKLAAAVAAQHVDVLDSRTMDQVIADGIARGRQEEAADWSECERIANLPSVDEILRGFSEDPTGDNGTMVVRAVLESLASPASRQPDQENKA